MMWKRYLLWFAHEHVDFRYPEIQSLLSLFKIPMRWVEKPTQESLYWIVELPSEECARQISSRSISLRWCIELWGRAKSQKLLHLNLEKSITNHTEIWHSALNDGDEEKSVANACPRMIMEPYFTKDKSFKITVETFCRHFSLGEKVKKIEAFYYIPMEGPIQLKNPNTELIYLEYYGLDPNNIPDDPHDLFMGRIISEGQRQLITKLSLKTRKFIGNTSMDAQLSVLMANQLQITLGDTVIDPFVGSGSLLVAAAEFGGFVWGSDIDFLMVHGKTRPTRVKQKKREIDESIRANMCQYKTQDHYLDVIVSDFSLPIWKDSMRFDAIITDPPYGIREPTEKIGIERENYTLSPEHLLNHYPAKVEYGLINIFSDLLCFAAKHLSLGRRLVCWFPLYRDDYREDILPSHRCLKLVANSEQVLSKYTSRRLLTYEKVSEPSSDGTTDESQPCDISRSASEEKSTTPERDVGGSDFRERYFNSGDQSRKEKKEQRANDRIRGKIEKALRLKREQDNNIKSCETYNVDAGEVR